MKKSLLNIILLITALVLVKNTISVSAQPISVKPESNVLYPMGYNAGGVNAIEDRDSVTIGSTTKYYILPSSNVNPGLIGLFKNMLSTFSWSIAPAAIATAQAVPVSAYFLDSTNYKQITWTAGGTGDILVTENAHATQGGCISSVVTSPVRVIAAPTLTAVDIANTTCQAIPLNLTSLPSASLTLTSVVNGNQNVIVTYTITGPSAYSYSNTANVGNSSTLSLSSVAAITVPGAYTLTINTVADRISTKCGITVNLVGISKVFYVTPIPRSLPTKHIKNDAGW